MEMEFILNITRITITPLEEFLKAELKLKLHRRNRFNSRVISTPDL